MNGSESFDPAPLPEGPVARLAVPLDALGPIPVSDAERQSLEWLCGFEAHTVENIVGLICRARGRSAVLAARGDSVPEWIEPLLAELHWLREALNTARDEVITRHVEANRCRGQLEDLCAHAGIDPEVNPHAALLAHLRGPEGPGQGVSS